MMIPDLSSEIKFQTTRSGGKGGQHVNKVETAVIGSFHVASSSVLSASQKEGVMQKLAGRISADGFLQVRSQVHRTQLRNKNETVEKINLLVRRAIEKKKPRIATGISKAAREKRLASKKRKAEIKAGRQKWREGD